MAVKEFDKYIVIKKEDLDYVFDSHHFLKEMFGVIIHLVEIYRIVQNKRPHNDYIVCNQDESYAEAVWRIILEGEDKKNEPI